MRPIPMRQARRRLAVIWLAGGGVLFVIIVLQSIFGKFGDKVDEAFQWFLPAIVPTCSLILGVLLASALALSREVKLVDRFVYRLTAALSLAYLLMVSLSILMSPFSETPPLELMRQSNLWLGPLQGLVGGALGLFFVSKEKENPVDGGG